MPISITSGNPSYTAAPVFLTTPYGQDQIQMIRFGGLPVPVTNQILPWMDLNDRIGWYAIGSPQIDNGHVANKAAALAWRGKGVWTAQDFFGRKIKIPAVYDETCGVPFSVAKAYLTQSGEQYLTFDMINGLRVRVNSFSPTSFLTGFPDKRYQYMHSVDLEFLSRNPFMQSIAPAASGTVNVGTQPNISYFSVPYLGMATSSPVFAISIYIENTVPINQVVIGNASSGEICYIVPSPALTGRHTVVFDSDQLMATLDGVAVAPGGSFPNLYPAFPPPSSMNMFAYVTTTTGAPANGAIILSMSWYTNWEI